MSGVTGLFTGGQGAVADDVQRVATVAAAGDDRLYSVLATPGAASKGVVPLEEESTTVNPRLLVYPATGGDQGRLNVRRCHLVAAVQDGLGQSVDLGVTTATTMLSALVGANASGNPRIDRLYVTINRAVPGAAVQQRRFKSTSASAVTTNATNIYNEPTATLAILAGTPAGSPVAPVLPTDSGTAWVIQLAQIYVANGYASGGPIGADAGAGVTTYVAQEWPNGQIPRPRSEGLKAASIFTAALNESVALSTLGLSRFTARNGADVQLFAGFRHRSTTTSFTLDNSINWRRRLIWGVLARGRDTGAPPNFPFVAATTLQGTSATQQLPPGLTGAGSVDPAISALFIGAGGGGVNVLIDIRSSAAGVLEAAIAGGPFDTTNGDTYHLVLWATNQLHQI